VAVEHLHGHTAIAHVVRLMDDRFSESAYCQARARLPVAVPRAALLDFVSRRDAAARAAEPDGHAPDAAHARWKGHRVALIDGTGVSVPDTPALRTKFGVAGGVAEGCGLPCPKVLAVFDAHDGMLVDMHIAPANAHDLGHAHDLHPALRPGDVLLGDRGLCSYVELALLLQRGCHGLFRMQAGRTMPFPARSGTRHRHAYDRHAHSEPVLVERIAQDDQVVEIVKPHNRPKHLTPGVFAAIPGKLVVRAVRYTVAQPGFRPHEITLLTTLTDAKAYSAEDLAGLYQVRWHVEVNLRHLKRTIGMERLRCQTVDGVTREALMLALIYNAVCHVRALGGADVAPTRMSFIDALRAMQVAGENHRAAAAARGEAIPPRRVILDHPPDLKAWPLRPGRVQPRQLKRAHSHFPIMTKPRAAYIQWATTRKQPAN
jgi:Transposase DDE domain